MYAICYSNKMRSVCLLFAFEINKTVLWTGVK